MNLAFGGDQKNWVPVFLIGPNSICSTFAQRVPCHTTRRAAGALFSGGDPNFRARLTVAFRAALGGRRRVWARWMPREEARNRT